MIFNIITKVCFGMLFGLTGIIFYCYSSDNNYEFGDEASFVILTIIPMFMSIVLFIMSIVYGSWLYFLISILFIALLVLISFDGIDVYNLDVNYEKRNSKENE